MTKKKIILILVSVAVIVIACISPFIVHAVAWRDIGFTDLYGKQALKKEITSIEIRAQINSEFKKVVVTDTEEITEFCTLFESLRYERRKEDGAVSLTSLLLTYADGERRVVSVGVAEPGGRIYTYKSGTADRLLDKIEECLVGAQGGTV